MLRAISKAQTRLTELKVCLFRSELIVPIIKYRFSLEFGTITGYFFIHGGFVDESDPIFCTAPTLTLFPPKAEY